MMAEDFDLRHEILVATQRWPILVLFCLVGSLLGWGISKFWPTPIRATTELYVGINVDQLNSYTSSEEVAGVHFLNADDFKNWQMANLNALVYMDEVIDETLSQLREADPYWHDVSRKQLRKSLHIYWRNAGKWRLVGENKNRVRAIQAVSTWQNIVVNRVHSAIEAARNIKGIDQQIDEISSAIAVEKDRSAELDYFLEMLQTRRDFLLDQSPDQPLNDNDRFSIWQPVAQVDLGAVWTPLAGEFPKKGSLAQSYLPWLDRADSAIQQEISRSQAQIEQLENEKQNLVGMFSQASQTSLGLSASLEVEPITSDIPVISVVRPTSQLILIGTLLGFISWLGYWLALYVLKVKS